MYKYNTSKYKAKLPLDVTSKSSLKEHGLEYGKGGIRIIDPAIMIYNTGVELFDKILNFAETQNKVDREMKMSEKIFISRFTVPEIGVDLAVDWYSVVSIQKQHLHVDIHLNTGMVLVVKAPSAEINQANFESLYEHWGRAITS